MPPGPERRGLSHARQEAPATRARWALPPLTQGVPEHVRLTCRRANAWLHVGRPIRPFGGDSILRDTTDRSKKDEHHGDASFQHSELPHCVPESALDVFFGCPALLSRAECSAARAPWTGHAGP